MANRAFFAGFSSCYAFFWCSGQRSSPRTYVWGPEKLGLSVANKKWVRYEVE